MQVPLHLTFNNMKQSDAIRSRVLEKVEHLDRLYADRLTSCRVMINAPHKHHRHGNRYEIRIFLGMPGGEIAVTRDPGDMNAHEDVYVAIRDAFSAAERQMKDYIRKHRGDVKVHGPAPFERRGKIAHLLADQSGGIIETSEGEVYFHRNSVVGATFDNLKVGEAVDIVVQYDESEKGPQASTVRPIRPSQFASSSR